MTSRNRYYSHAKVCEQCSDIFHSSRYDAKFCSSRCRAKNHRDELKRSQSLERIKDAIDKLLMNESMTSADSLAREIAAYASAYEVRTVGDKRE